METLKNEWFSNIKQDLLSSFVVGLSMIPETAGFALMVGLSPSVAFYTTFYMSIILAFFGGRRAMISAAAGSVALILIGVTKNFGIEYIGIVTVMTGLLQILFGILKIQRLLKYVPQSVMYGFVNALGILLLKEQFKYFLGQSYIMYILVILGLIAIYAFPLITKKIPANLICIILVTAIAIIFNLHTQTLGSIDNTSMVFKFLTIPNLSLDILFKLLPYAISLALVGTIESLLTAKTLDTILNNKSNKNRETIAQGLGNLTSGLLGGMTGCALVGQSIINTKSGAKTRLSTFFAGFSLIVLVSLFSHYVAKIPIAAVVAVMIMISFTTFDFKSITNIKIIGLKDTLIMLIVVILVLLTNNLAIGVVIGSLLNFLITKFTLA